MNKAGETPLDIAERYGTPELVSVLREAGAANSKDLGKPPSPAKQLKQTVSNIKHDVQSQLQQTRQTGARVHKIAKRLKKLHISGLNNAINSATVVAVLIAIVAFAAIFTVPGQMEDKQLRSLRKVESQSRSFTNSMASEPEILNHEYKRMYALCGHWSWEETK
ncbi:hypothetical protein CMV_017374 [Castanea mollissima]|uniref:PGG domain-containing protein n=1 Tax=Castanea mollissima TaxID=60419 RepID=A0A8J4R509_9ROSI|nr:hypothetical protein CMV_017374 [Castanea mollissima]